MSSWWEPHRHADRRPALLARGRIKAAARAWFEEQGFTEVECGALAVSPGNEAHLHAYRTDAGPYLHTSPEFASKKLLAAGETRIFDFARVFRARERGPLHAPEFTMLEWYRANEDYAAVTRDCLALLRLAAETTGIARFAYRSHVCDPRAEAERLSVADAFLRHAKVDLLATVDERGQGARDRLAAEARRTGFEIADDDNWADIFSKILVARVEPKLGLERPTILCEYPRCEAALARAAAHDPRVAERFELYACGIELANGFGELTDPIEQRARFEAEMDEKARVHGERYPIDEDFLGALAHMPPASGVALGFDRLVMLATGSRKLEDVLWTPAPQYTVEVCKPADFSKEDFETGVRILEDGGAVDPNSACQEIPQATLVAVLRHDRNLVGTGAIKRERREYAERVQGPSKAGYKFDPSILELGYVAISRQHQGRRLSGRIVDKLLELYGGPLFATTDKQQMKRTLCKRGFTQCGKEWNGKKGKLSLWLRGESR